MKITEKTYANFKWTDIENPTLEKLQNIQQRLGIDENYLEDTLEPGHLPKIEKTKSSTFIILRAFTADQNEKVIEVGQISSKIAFLIYKDELITLHRAPFSFLDSLTFDFVFINNLVISIINEILLTYEQPIQNQLIKMDVIERQIFLKKGDNLSIESLYYEKSRARLSKKLLLITQHIINEINVEDNLKSNVQDLKDTTVDLILRTEEVIDDSMSLLSTFISITGQKNNDVMKLLTVFSAFFLPLTFIVGLYGMNFDHMPELSWEYGYYIILLVMIFIAVAVYIWFKRNRIL